MYSYIWKTQNTIISESTFGSNVLSVVPILWREHCLECAMPLCYNTCSIYTPRMDGRCLRFTKGIVPVSYKDHPCKGAIIEFRRWAKLQANLPLSLEAISCRKIAKRQKFLLWGETLVRAICGIVKNYRLSQIYASLTERINTKRLKADCFNVTHFIATINNRESGPRKLILEIISDETCIYKYSFELKPGWNETILPIVEIKLPESTAHETFIRAFLDNNETALLEFKNFDFVKMETTSRKPASHIKCIGWDLDNTLWDGVLGDDGIDGVKVNDKALALIKELDERGIIQTIVSKNSYDVVWPFIVSLNLGDYFLYPAINWGRKSQNLLSIAKELNINIDTFGLIDDSKFEREEVNAALPQVRIYDANEIDSLIDREEFNVPISEESRKRRQSYINESKRKLISASWDGDYDSFLKECKLKMEISNHFDLQAQERCLELINRSNQYNISGQRYIEEEFKKILSNSNYACYFFSIADKFGNYGIVGFASIVMEDDSLRLKDFVMSCRVAQKKAERAFLNSLFSIYNKNIWKIEIHKTNRNSPLQKEFGEMGLHLLNNTEKEINYCFDSNNYDYYLDDHIYDVFMNIDK